MSAAIQIGGDSATSRALERRLGGVVLVITAWRGRAALTRGRPAFRIPPLIRSSQPFVSALKMSFRPAFSGGRRLRIVTRGGTLSLSRRDSARRSPASSRSCVRMTVLALRRTLAARPIRLRWLRDGAPAVDSPLGWPQLGIAWLASAGNVASTPILRRTCGVARQARPDRSYCLRLMPACRSLHSGEESCGRAEAKGILLNCDSPGCTRWLIERLTRLAHPRYGFAVPMHGRRYS